MLRNWHSREAGVVQTVRGLLNNAEAAARAVETGDASSILHNLNIN